MRGTKDRYKALAGIDAVLQWNDSCVFTDQWADLLCRSFDIPELHAEQHKVDGTDRGGIVRCLHWADNCLATVTFNPQTVGTHARKMRPPREECDILARDRERSAQRCADTSGADNGNTHG